MFFGLTASARDWFPGCVVGDTSVIPTSVKINSTSNKKSAGGTAKKLASLTPAEASKKAKAGEISFGEPETGVGAGGAKGSGVGEKKGEKSGSKTGDSKSVDKIREGKAADRANDVKAARSSSSTNSSAAPRVSAASKTSTASKASTISKTSTTSKTSASSKTTLTNKSTNTKSNLTKSSSKNLSSSKTFNPNTTATVKTTKTSKKSRKLRKGIGIELYQPLTFKYAILLDVPVEKVTDEKLLEVLDHWYGTRYRFGGESRKGIDCSAFTQAFMRSYLDYKLPRVAAEQYNTCNKIKKKKLRQGDLVFFKTHGPKGGISHVGVYLFNDRFVHSASSTGVRISNLNDDYYMEKYAGAGRIR
jgi:cell wall-associated NlpC family hydrolase